MKKFDLLFKSLISIALITGIFFFSKFVKSYELAHKYTYLPGEYVKRVDNTTGSVEMLIPDPNETKLIFTPHIK